MNFPTQPTASHDSGAPQACGPATHAHPAKLPLHVACSSSSKDPRQPFESQERDVGQDSEDVVVVVVVAEGLLVGVNENDVIAVVILLHDLVLEDEPDVSEGPVSIGGVKPPPPLDAPQSPV